MKKKEDFGSLMKRDMQDLAIKNAKKDIDFINSEKPIYITCESCKIERNSEVKECPICKGGGKVNTAKRWVKKSLPNGVKNK